MDISFFKGNKLSIKLILQFVSLNNDDGQYNFILSPKIFIILKIWRVNPLIHSPPKYHLQGDTKLGFLKPKLKPNYQKTGLMAKTHQ